MLIFGVQNSFLVELDRPITRHETQSTRKAVFTSDKLEFANCSSEHTLSNGDVHGRQTELN